MPCRAVPCRAIAGFGVLSRSPRARARARSQGGVRKAQGARTFKSAKPITRNTRQARPPDPGGQPPAPVRHNAAHRLRPAKSRGPSPPLAGHQASAVADAAGAPAARLCSGLPRRRSIARQWRERPADVRPAWPRGLHQQLPLARHGGITVPEMCQRCCNEAGAPSSTPTSPLPRRCSSHSALTRWLRAGSAASAAAANKSAAHRKLSLHGCSQGLKMRDKSAHCSMRCQPAGQAQWLTATSVLRQAAWWPASAAAGG